MKLIILDKCINYGMSACHNIISGHACLEISTDLGAESGVGHVALPICSLLVFFGLMVMQAVVARGSGFWPGWLYNR